MGSLKVLSWAPLFLLFINDLAINRHNNSGLYADATVYMSAPNLSTIQQKLQADIDIILKWTNEENATAINHDKTSNMIMGTRQKVSHLDNCALNLSLSISD